MLKAGSACVIPHTSYMHVFIKSSQPSFPPISILWIIPILNTSGCVFAQQHTLNREHIFYNLAAEQKGKCYKYYKHQWYGTAQNKVCKGSKESNQDICKAACISLHTGP